MKSLLFCSFLAVFGSLLAPSAHAVTIEYGMFEKSSDGKFQSLCPVKDDGSVTCNYTYGLQQASVVIDRVDVSVHQQIMKSLAALGALPFLSYDESIRKMIPSSPFLLIGFYVKFDSRTVLIDFAHYYTPLQAAIPSSISGTVSTILKIMSQVYYTHTKRMTPLVKKANRCPVLVGRYQCARNTLEITQLTYGVDDLYVFNYSDRTQPFDFGANDLGMKNAFDRYTAICNEQGLSLDGSVIRLTGANRDLEFLGGASNSMVCRRMSSFWDR